MREVVVFVYLERANYKLKQVIVVSLELVDHDHCNWYAKFEFEAVVEQVVGRG